MIAEIGRAAATVPAADAEYPFVLAAGLRTRWTANTIQRDPPWRKGSGPHCALNLSPSDATRLGVSDGDALRVFTHRGSLMLPAQDRREAAGRPRMDAERLRHDGVRWRASDRRRRRQQNELTDVADRDPFTGIPHHRYVRCRIERA